MNQIQTDYDDDALAEADAWAASHADFICAVFAEFTTTGHWPSPKELQRKLHRHGSDIPVYDLAEELPRQLARIFHWSAEAASGGHRSVG